MALFLCLTGAVTATTVVVPENPEELAGISDCVVFARAEASRPTARGVLPFVETTFSVLKVTSGTLAAGEKIQVIVPGGTIAGGEWIVPGAPSFVEGDRYLLYLTKGADNCWMPVALSYCLMREASDPTTGETILAPLPEARQLSAVSTNSGGKNMKGLEDCHFFTSSSSGYNCRWKVFDSGSALTVSASSSGADSLTNGGFTLLAEALNLWSDIPGTRFNLVMGPAEEADVSCTSGQDYVRNLVLFDDPCSDIPPLWHCSGVLAFGGPIISGSHTFNGERWGTIVGWLMVVSEGIGCMGDEAVRLTLAHELGHCLGFQHADDSNALMYEYCCNGINGTDQECALFAYPARTPDNLRPRIDLPHPQPLTVNTSIAQLEATVQDDGLPADPGSVTLAWSLIHGPGPVTFSAPGSAVTDVGFEASGSYLFGITASDGDLIRMEVLAVEVDLNAGELFRRGDANDDGAVDLSDAITTLLCLFDGETLACPDAADSNDDGTLNLGDPVFLLSYLFAHGESPALPGTDCGEDRTGDDLPFCGAESCGSQSP